MNELYIKTVDNKHIYHQCMQCVNVIIVIIIFLKLGERLTVMDMVLEKQLQERRKKCIEYCGENGI